MRLIVRQPLGAPSPRGRNGGGGGGKSGGGGGHSGGRAPAGGGTQYRLDGMLGPRVEDYVRTREDIDVDELVEYLRCGAATRLSRRLVRRVGGSR